MFTQSDTTGSVKVWDPLVRIFHWSLVFAFLLALITEDDWMSLHLAAGYAVAMLIGFRLLWGVIGTRYARFSEFIKSPTEVIAYAKQMLRLKPPHFVGHNPLATVMIVCLLLSMTTLSLTGFILIATEGEGLLAGTVFASMNADITEELHEFFANFTLLLVVAHIAGVIVSSLLEGENLARVMVTGRKKQRHHVSE